VLLDGLLSPIDRIAADRPFCSGEHEKHGMNVRIPADPFGRLLWASPALPGAVHGVRAAREHGVIRTLADVVSSAGPTSATEVPEARSASRTGAAGRTFPQVRRVCVGVPQRSARPHPHTSHTTGYSHRSSPIRDFVKIHPAEPRPVDDYADALGAVPQHDQPAWTP
jgi:hypothetical protein